MDERRIIAAFVFGLWSFVFGHTKTELRDLRDNAIGAQRLWIVPHSQPRQRRVGGDMLDTRQPAQRQLDRAGFGGAAHTLHRADVLRHAGRVIACRADQRLGQAQGVAKPMRQRRDRLGRGLLTVVLKPQLSGGEVDDRVMDALDPRYATLKGPGAIGAVHAFDREHRVIVAPRHACASLAGQLLGLGIAHHVRIDFENQRGRIEPSRRHAGAPAQRLDEMPGAAITIGILWQHLWAGQSDRM